MILPKNNTKTFKFAYITVFILFIVLRLFSWSNSTGLEDHDSIQYLKLIEFFNSFTFEGLINLGPDDLILYPMLSALFKFFGFSVEFSGRLLTFLVSVGLFFVIYDIQKRLWGKEKALLGNLIFSFNPYLITFSYSILTEPLYNFIIYFAVWLFFKQLNTPSFRSAIYLGVIIGLSFIARTEGIIFLVAIPAMQLIHFVLKKKKNYNFKRYLLLSTVFAVLFSVVVLPQVLRVSNSMGTFVINGRQAWMKLLKSDIDKSTDEKIYGLDFSPSEINIHHVQKNPNVYHSLKSETKLSSQIKTFIYTFNEFYNIKLTSFFGLMGLIFFGFGIYYLLIKGKFIELIIILFFIAVCIFPPLMHNVVTRHIAIIGPIVIMLQSLGIYFIAESIIEKYPRLFGINLNRYSIILILFSLSILFKGHSLYMSLVKPTENTEYSKQDYNETIKILKENSNNFGKNDFTIVSRKGYFPYFADVNYISTPYSNYSKFLEYVKLNNVKFVFLEHQTLGDFPFMDNFVSGITPEFIKLDSRLDFMGHKLELYKLK